MNQILFLAHAVFEKLYRIRNADWVIIKIGGIVKLRHFSGLTEGLVPLTIEEGHSAAKWTKYEFQFYCRSCKISMYSKRTPGKTNYPAQTQYWIPVSWIFDSPDRARLLDLHHSLVLTLSSDVSEYVTTPASGFALVASHEATEISKLWRVAKIPLIWSCRVKLIKNNLMCALNDNLANRRPESENSSQVFVG